MYSRGVQKYNLKIIAGIYSLDTVSCSLRLIGNNKRFPAKQRINQGGLPTLGRP